MIQVEEQHYPKKDPNDELYKMPYINMPGQNKYKFYNDKKHAEDYFIKITQK